MSARAPCDCPCGGPRTLVIVYTREAGPCGYLSALWAWLRGVDQ